MEVESNLNTQSSKVAMESWGCIQYMVTNIKWKHVFELFAGW